MSVKLVVAGFVMSGLVSAGAVTVLVVSQPAPVKQVQFVAPASVQTVATVAPTTVAPAPVESTTTAAPVVAPTSEAPVAVKSPAPAPVRATVSAPRAAGTYPDGSPFKYDSLGRLIQPDVAPAPGMYGSAPQGVLGGPTPTPTP
jgi:hypothetical protein